MIVGVCGYGYSGSGAVLDYLREYEECFDVIDGVEFNLAYMPHGIQDLEYHLVKQVSRYYSSDAAIKDFLCLIKSMDSPNSIYRKKLGDKFSHISDDFIASVTQLSWSGWWGYDYIRMNNFYRTIRFRIIGRILAFLEQYLHLRLNCFKNEKMYLAICPDDFDIKARKYLQELISAFGYGRNKSVLLDQPFEANNPMQSMKYYKQSRAIVVDRDPRDIYCLEKHVWKDGMIPTDVETFCKWFKYTRANRDKELENPRVNFIQFEDLIFNYDKTKNQVENWLNLSTSDHKNVKKYFDPSFSIKNTRTWIKYKSEKENIAYIEKYLSDYLYKDFD